MTSTGDPELITTADAARMLSVPRGRVLELAAAAPDFPAADIHPGGGWAWPRQALEAWAAAHPDRGPLSRGPRIGPLDSWLQYPQIDELFQLALQEAQALHHRSIVEDHLLVALLHPGSPGQARAVLRSLGITLERLRQALLAAGGDRYEPGLDMVWFHPDVRLLLERANLEAVLLNDSEVASEHLLLSMTHRWDRSEGMHWLQRCGIDGAAVRRRVMDLTEGVPLPEAAPLVEPAAEPDPTAGLDLAPTPDGKDPRRRRPWGSAVFTDADGLPLTQGRAMLQYYIDRDGNPVLTTDGRPVHVLLDEDGNDLLDEQGESRIGPVEVPAGAEIQRSPQR